MPSPEQTKGGGTGRNWGVGNKIGRNFAPKKLKTDILRLQIMRYFKNFVFMFEKSDVRNNRAKNLFAAVNATRSATRILLRGKSLNEK